MKNIGKNSIANYREKGSQTVKDNENLSRNDLEHHPASSKPKVRRRDRLPGKLATPATRLALLSEAGLKPAHDVDRNLNCRLGTWRCNYFSHNCALKSHGNDDNFFPHRSPCTFPRKRGKKKLIARTHERWFKPRHGGGTKRDVPQEVPRPIMKIMYTGLS